jgi:hypothetical protein
MNLIAVVPPADAGFVFQIARLATPHGHTMRQWTAARHRWLRFF